MWMWCDCVRQTPKNGSHDTPFARSCAILGQRVDVTATVTRRWLPTMTGTNLMKMRTRNYRTVQCALYQSIVSWPARLTNSPLQHFERKHDVILFAMDCSQSMLALREDPNDENKKTSHLLKALDAALQIQKRKVVVGPYDSVGIMLYNTVRILFRIIYALPDDIAT
jgi:hypothetical protein